jgi:hypothetical protein
MISAFKAPEKNSLAIDDYGRHARYGALMSIPLRVTQLRGARVARKERLGFSAIEPRGRVLHEI